MIDSLDFRVFYLIGMAVFFYLSVEEPIKAVAYKIKYKTSPKINWSLLFEDSRDYLWTSGLFMLLFFANSNYLRIG